MVRPTSKCAATPSASQPARCSAPASHLSRKHQHESAHQCQHHVGGHVLVALVAVLDARLPVLHRLAEKTISSPVAPPSTAPSAVSTAGVRDITSRRVPPQTEAAAAVAAGNVATADTSAWRAGAPAPSPLIAPKTWSPSSPRCTWRTASATTNRWCADESLSAPPPQRRRERRREAPCMS